MPQRKEAKPGQRLFVNPWRNLFLKKKIRVPVPAWTMREILRGVCKAHRALMLLFALVRAIEVIGEVAGEVSDEVASPCPRYTIVHDRVDVQPFDSRPLPPF